MFNEVLKLKPNGSYPLETQAIYESNPNYHFVQRGVASDFDRAVEFYNAEQYTMAIRYLREAAFAVKKCSHLKGYKKMVIKLQRKLIQCWFQVQETEMMRYEGDILRDFEGYAVDEHIDE